MRATHVSLFALTVLVIALAGCVSRDVLETRQLSIGHVDLQNVQDGAYSGDFTYGKFTYEVRVTVKDHRISSIDVVKNRETKPAKMAEGVVKEILAQQRNDVDVVSGATTTSKALLKAVENAITKGFLQ